MPITDTSPYERWDVRKAREKREAREVSRKGHPTTSRTPKLPQLPKVARIRQKRECAHCGEITVNAKYCGRSCNGKRARMAQLDWERSVAAALVKEGWEIISPTACCDRIGIRDGRVYFLEFKPEGDTSLRKFQKSVQVAAPDMYRVVVGTKTGDLSVVRHGRSKRWANSSIPSGTSWCKGKKKWKARIFIEGKSMHLGYFNTKDEAGRAYLDASQFLIT